MDQFHDGLGFDLASRMRTWKVSGFFVSIGPIAAREVSIEIDALSVNALAPFETFGVDTGHEQPFALDQIFVGAQKNQGFLGKPNALGLVAVDTTKDKQGTFLLGPLKIRARIKVDGKASSGRLPCGTELAPFGHETESRYS